MPPGESSADKLYESSAEFVAGAYDDASERDRDDSSRASDVDGDASAEKLYESSAEFVPGAYDDESDSFGAGSSRASTGKDFRGTSKGRRLLWD